MTIRDPRTDPQPGDTLRHSRDRFPRKVLTRGGDRVLVEFGTSNHFWTKLATWRKWAADIRVVIVNVVANQER
jgi:hypothetical protein